MSQGPAKEELAHIASPISSASTANLMCFAASELQHNVVVGGTSVHDMYNVLIDH